MFTVVKKVQSSLVEDGLSQTFRKAIDYLTFKRAINKRRQQLSIEVAQAQGWQVAHGPFVGMQIASASWWGQTDLASKILGFYEAEVLAVLSSVDKSRYKHFVDLGAADGYYAIGCVYAGLFCDAYAFEMSNQGQSVIRANAQLNGVTDSIHIHGFADENFDRMIPQVCLSQAVILVDIEGGEFDLINDLILQKLNQSFLIIELHEFMVDNGAEKLAALIARLEKVYKLTWLSTGSRDLSRFNSLMHYNDSDRWLLCSEGRMQLQRWVVCEPHAL